MILLSTVPAYAKENDKPISNLLVSQNELALELSHYFAEDSNGDIHFTATKSDLRRLGIFDKDAEIILSFTSKELNVFSEQLDNSLVINEKSSEVMDRNYIQELSTEYKYYFNPLSIKHNFIGKEPIILEIDNSNLDFLNNEDDRKFIIKKVENAIESLGGHKNV